MIVLLPNASMNECSLETWLSDFMGMFDQGPESVKTDLLKANDLQSLRVKVPHTSNDLSSSYFEHQTN